jgi:hypothetical protein
MADSSLPQAESIIGPCTELLTASTADSTRVVLNSATPSQGQLKGFPVMPPANNMLGMPTRPIRPSSREKQRPRNGPAIEDWEAVLVGRKLVPEDYLAKRRAQIALGLRSSVQASEGALGRLPTEIVTYIEQILEQEEQRTVCLLSI